MKSNEILEQYVGKQISKISADKFDMGIIFTDGSKIEISADGYEGSKLSVKADVRITKELDLEE